MNCPQGHTNEKNARFCAICGAKLVVSPWLKVILAVVFVTVAIVTSYYFGARAILWVLFFVVMAYMPLLGVWSGLWLREKLRNETTTKTNHVHKGRNGPLGPST